MHDNCYSEMAERSVLGSILVDGLKGMETCLRLRPEHFFLASHREIFEVCRQKLAQNELVDYQVVRDALGSKLDSVGGMSYLHSLSDGIFRGFDASQRVETILEAARLRRGMELCENFAKRFAGGEQASETLASLQSEVFELLADNGEQDDPHVAGYSDVVFDELMTRSNSSEASGLSYGHQGLDDWTGGMQPGQVTVVGARSGVGKSSLMKQAAVANACKGIAVAMFSLEMSRSELLEGIWSIVSGVEFRKVSRPYLLNIAERESLREAYRKVKAWPLRIYDKADLRLNEIIALARMNVRQFGAQLVVVDYAQNVEADGKDERTKVADISRKLTKMAKTEGCHLILLSQLRKVPIEQYSHAPSVADLRETGQLENDAHVVVLLHRGWDSVTCHLSNDVAIIVPKIRRGQTGAIEASFNPKNLCFSGPLENTHSGLATRAGGK